MVRGGISVIGDLSAYAPLNIAGGFVAGDLYLTRRTGSGTVDPWNAPLLAQASASLASVNATLLVVTPGGGVSTYLGTTDAYPGPRSITFDGFKYALGYDSTSPAVQDAAGSYYIKPYALVVKSASGALSFSAYTNAPRGAVDLIGYQSRLWLLGGIDTPGGGTTHSCTTLFFSNPLAPGSSDGSASADWKDPVSGLTNLIRMDNDSSDPGIALAKVRNGLLILRHSSVWLLRGTTTANYALTPISKQVGCVDPRSVVEVDAGVYFVSEQGLMLTNGTAVANVSGSVMYTLRQAVAAVQQQIRSGYGGHVSCARTSQGQILVSIGYPNSTGHNVTLWSGLYDPTVIKGGAWVRVTSQVWSNDSVQTGANLYPGHLFWSSSPAQLYTVGDSYATVMEDVTTGATFLQQAALYDKLVSGANPYVAIPATWKTRFVPIVGTTTLARKYANTKRFFLDYAFGASGLTPTTGWNVNPVDSTDTQYSGSSSLQAALGSAPATTGSVSGVTPVADPIIQRQNSDFVNEVSDLGFDITWTDATARAAPATGVAAELFGIGVEYQPARDLR